MNGERDVEEVSERENEIKGKKREYKKDSFLLY